MIVDSSALVAILNGEAECAAYVKAVADAAAKWMSAASPLETLIVMRREKGAEGVRILRQFISDADIRIVALTEADAEIAFDAYLRFGKGMGMGHN